MRHALLALTTVAATAGAAPAAHAAPSRSWQDCGRAATATAAQQAGVGAAMDNDPKLQAVFSDTKPSTVYGAPNRALCADYDADGDLDRLAWYRCCTVSSPSPFVIVRNDGATFAIAYARWSDTVFSLRAREPRRLLERMPEYARTDPNCCPSRYRDRTIRWDGKRFRSTVRVVRARR